MIRPRERKKSKNVVVLPPHPLISAILTRSSTDKEVQSLFADFRAQGGTIRVCLQLVWTVVGVIDAMTKNIHYHKFSFNTHTSTDK